ACAAPRAGLAVRVDFLLTFDKMYPGDCFAQFFA
ncbi:hypothetical protein A2U01_0094813, partial [Trifolium medium]|nr:hypothetical protein [Trifolium medium]